MGGSKVLHLDASSFDQVIQGSDRPVVVDFWAEWCPPCRVFGPVFEEVAEELSDKALFAKVNVDEAPEVAERFDIRAIPTVMVFVNGRPVDRVIGAIGKEALVALVMKHV